MLSDAARRCCQTLQEDAVRRCKKMLSDAVKHEEEDGSGCQLSIMKDKIICTTKLFEESIEVAKSIYDISFKSQALSTIASALAQSGKIDEATKLFEESIEVAKSIYDGSDRSQAITKIIIMQLKSEICYSKDLIKMVTKNMGNNLLDIVSNSLNVTKDLWNYTIKQCIGYLEISYSVCSLIAKRHPKYSLEIADLILKYNF